MTELILTMVLGGSAIGLTVIFFRKIPVLVELPETPIKFPKITEIITEIIRNFPGIRNFSYEFYLQKILSKIRILTLKTDSKTSAWLEKLRQKNNQKNNHNNHYWDELKKAKNGR